MELSLKVKDSYIVYTQKKVENTVPVEVDIPCIHYDLLKKIGEIQPEKEVSDILATEVKSLREDVNIIKGKIPVDQELKRQQFEEMKSQNSWNRLMDLGKFAKNVAPLFKEDNDECDD